MTFDDIHKLIKKSDIVSLRDELDTGVSPNFSNQYSWTLLMLAALEGNRSIGELLISRGANVNAVNDVGETALSLAAHGGHVPFIRILLDGGASTECQPHGSSLEDRMKAASGLSQNKIASVLNLINSARRSQQRTQ